MAGLIGHAEAGWGFQVVKTADRCVPVPVRYRRVLPIQSAGQDIGGARWRIKIAAVLVHMQAAWEAGAA